MKKSKSIMMKVFKTIFIVGVVGLLLLLGINVYVRGTVKERIVSIEEAESLSDVDCIIVLGASVNNNEYPSPMLEDRLKRGIELYYKECAPKIIMSGDHGGLYYDEVNVMKNYAINNGVPSEDVFMDHAGFSTYESMYRAKEVFGADKVIVVTQGYHLDRAVYIGKKMGLDVYGVSAEDIRYGGQFARDVREFLAIGKDFFTTLLNTEPTFLGDNYDLSGSGDVTNDR